MLIKVSELRKNKRLEYLFTLSEFKDYGILFDTLSPNTTIDTDKGIWPEAFAVMDRMNPRYVWMKVTMPGDMIPRWYKIFQVFADEEFANQQEEKALAELGTEEDLPLFAFD